MQRGEMSGTNVFRQSRGPGADGSTGASSTMGFGGASGQLPPLASVTSAGSAKARRLPRRTELTADEVQEIRETFDLFDSDKDGLIDHHELKVRSASRGAGAARHGCSRWSNAATALNS